ncbi:hypothetical protein [Massilia antarctica]|uniref:hypothetical protein n=1 Tax=Massilia antarctica TaxID=2765360 RepID=UPI0006BB6B11|nr:hypothetical protein [Massilia sp. H27-R4]MCY0910293.1 hypothetical protein [Massilia sp. H27-R4]CUI09352.1 hypothetical protein BN2497_13481 [Janthinobacterium sp. CG23_2]CUU33138.1 hypothetical protein BN3177_13481 [Janthinobacterium sp. CG23_2]
MSTSAIGASSPATTTQASQYRSASTGAARPAAGAPPDGKAFVSAIASALQEIGVADADAAESTASADPAAALGDFLNELMASLQPAGGKGPQGPPPGGAGPRPGGGGMRSDLASLVGSLSKQASSAIDTDDSDTTDITDTADVSSSTARLESSFGTLLGALGLDSADSSSKLGQFLQTLATKLDAAGPAGNLINTTA